MGTIREATKKDGTVSFHAEIRIKGSQPQRASFRTRTLAKKWVQDIESAIRDGRHFLTVESKKHTVAELIDRYIEEWISRTAKYQKKKTAHLLWWKQQLGHLVLADLTPSQIAACRDKLLNETTCRKRLRSGSTANRYLAAFSKALAIAMREWAWIEQNPMSKISKPKEGRSRERFLSKEEIKRLLEACEASSNPYIFTLVKLALASAMRHGEMISLRWRDVDFSTRLIVLQETKNGSRRAIPLTNEIEEILKACPTFGSPLHEPIFKAIYNRRGAVTARIRGAFQAAVKLARIENFVFHDLRRTAASHLAMAGASQNELMALLGHKSPRMTSEVYVKFSLQHLANIMERTQKQIFEGK